jgi:hypothetical protein
METTRARAAHFAGLAQWGTVQAPSPIMPTMSTGSHR